MPPQTQPAPLVPLCLSAYVCVYVCAIEGMSGFELPTSDSRAYRSTALPVVHHPPPTTHHPPPTHAARRPLRRRHRRHCDQQRQALGAGEPGRALRCAVPPPPPFHPRQAAAFLAQPLLLPHRALPLPLTPSLPPHPLATADLCARGGQPAPAGHHQQRLDQRGAAEGRAHRLGQGLAANQAVLYDR